MNQAFPRTRAFACGAAGALLLGSVSCGGVVDREPGTDDTHTGAGGSAGDDDDEPAPGGRAGTGGRPAGGTGGRATTPPVGAAGAGIGGGISMPACGDGIVDPAELCDGTNLRGETCASATMMALPIGALRCTAQCFFDTSGCASPGTGGGPNDDHLYECELHGPREAPGLLPVEPVEICGSFMGGPEMGFCLPDLTMGGPFGWPQDVCAANERCYPMNKVEASWTCFARCESSIGGAGACVPTYVVEASPDGMGLSDVLGRATCSVGETCTPCISPLTGEPTGACYE